jgi:antitoxin YefM
MPSITVNQFRANLKKVVDKTINEHEPLHVTRKRGANFVVVSEEDWNREQETLYVLQNSALMKQIAQSLASRAAKKTLNKEELHAEFDIQG